MVNLNIGTFNLKGLANDKKRKEIFNHNDLSQINMHIPE
jgi:hypothetical protein